MRCRSLVAEAVKIALVGSACVAGWPVAWAQTSPATNESTTPAPAAAPPELEEIVVSGYRRSLNEATEAKRESTGFTDAIFAEDIGKFPDTNIAESFNRIPGITIIRDFNGEGVNVAIRGLGVNFTRVTLNNAPVAVASSGRTDAQNTNREVDLNMFPTELFTQLTVRKSASASMLEGGAAGTVDMRSARPFDNPGEHITYSVQGTKNTVAHGLGERGSLIASKTWDKFGILVGAAGVRNSSRVTGFETVGWTNPNLTVPNATSNPPITAAQAQCLSGSACNATGGGNWTIPGTVPANAGNGLTPGDVINQAWLLAHNPGLSLQQIDNAIIPRLGRPVDEFGTEKRYNGIVSMEFRPTDDLRFYLDSMYGKRKNDQQRIDMNWVGRNGAAIPINMQVDKSDCSNGCTVTQGTFANSQFLLEYRPWIEDVDFWGANPGLQWQIADDWKVDLQANKTHSTYHREVPSVLVATAPSSGLTVNYVNNGDIPTMGSNVDLNNPANFFWNGSARVNIQDERRQTDTKGVRGNLNFGHGGPFNVAVGAAYDDVSRRINAYDGSQAWQNAVCGDNPNIFLMNPNTQPPCQGLSTATPGAGYPTYPGLGTRATVGYPALVYQGSLIPQSALQSYIHPGPDGFITIDWRRFAADSNYAKYHAMETDAGGANTGANAGFIEEKTTGLYTELNGDMSLGGHRLRYTAGVRWVRTNQTIGGWVTISDPRNVLVDASGKPILDASGKTQQIPDGSRYPNIMNFIYTENQYNNTLPSAELAYNLRDDLVLRLAGSRTMTRPDPNAMLPGASFSSPSADVGSVGNPALKPFLSDNVDLGLEWYTGKEGYVGLAGFHKHITGFTANGNTTVPFSALAQYGITYDTLTPTQQAAINSRGGPTVATVVLTQQVNASGALTVNGLEANWVQPLDFLLGRFGLEGFGFQANYTLIHQTGTGAAPAIALGVAPHTYNVTAYYEHGPFMARLSTVYNQGSQSSNPNQNGITRAALFSDNYTQWDFSSSLDLSKLFSWKNELQITLDGVNLFNEKQRSYFQFPNATFNEYSPGRTYILGLRGRF